MRSFKSLQNEYYTSEKFNPLKETGKAYHSTTRYLLDGMAKTGKDITIVEDVISLKGLIDRFFRNNTTNGIRDFASWFFDGLSLNAMPPETAIIDTEHAILTAEEEKHGAYTFYYFNNGAPLVNTIITPLNRNFLALAQDAAMIVASEEKEELHKHYEINSLLKKTLAYLKGTRREAQNAEETQREEERRREVAREVQNIVLAIPFMPKDVTTRAIENMTAVGLGGITAPPPSENDI